MKYLIPILLLPIFTNAQVFPTKGGEVYYEFIDSFPGQSKADLYKKAEFWAASQFRDAKQAVQLADAENGELIAKGSLPLQISIMNGILQMTIKISTRDNKCRVSIYNAMYTENIAGTTAPIGGYTRKRHIAKFNATMIELKENIFASMRRNVADTF